MGIESFDRRVEIPRSSPRAFGLTFAAVFLIVAVYPLFFSSAIRFWALGTAVSFLAVSVVAPNLLSPLNRYWFQFGMFLHRVMNPIVLGVMFFLLITPMGLFMRWVGRDLLRMRLDKDAKSYWIVRDPPGPPPESLRDQF